MRDDFSYYYMSPFMNRKASTVSYVNYVDTSLLKIYTTDEDASILLYS